MLYSRESCFRVFLSFLMLCSLVAAQTDRGSANRVLREPGGNLNEAAKLAGGTYVENRGNLDGPIDYDDVASILNSSSVVVIGTANDNVCTLTSDSRDIRTVQAFSVERVLKGKVHPGEIIKVMLPGGRFTFQDGTVAQINTPKYKRMLNGSRYVLFLTETAGTDLGYSPIGGSQGIFELRADGTVLPHAQASFEKFRGHEQGELIGEIERSSHSEESHASK